MRKYKCLPVKKYSLNEFSLLPIRDEDKYTIMKWRNEQIDILRQKEPLTKEKQELYFSNVVDKLFEQEKPDQLLFSFLENDILIGYGGLVHIDWESRNAEVSFITVNDGKNNKQGFINDWRTFLVILKQIAGQELNFVKIYTYAYDLRPLVFRALEESNFQEEARLKNHIFINGNFYDVVMHAFFLKDA
jgi:Acetyltransferase (GNAT) domain